MEVCNPIPSTKHDVVILTCLGKIVQGGGAELYALP